MEHVSLYPPLKRHRKESHNLRRIRQMLQALLPPENLVTAQSEDLRHLGSSDVLLPPEAPANAPVIAGSQALVKHPGSVAPVVPSTAQPLWKPCRNRLCTHSGLGMALLHVYICHTHIPQWNRGALTIDRYTIVWLPLVTEFLRNELVSIRKLLILLMLERRQSLERDKEGSAIRKQHLVALLGLVWPFFQSLTKILVQW